MASSDRYGASPAEWDAFLRLIGPVDLLPCVSNPQAVISPLSKMAAVGKTPSWYNGRHQAVGISNWTSKQSTAKDVEQWKGTPDYGICLQTRKARAIDVDIPDADEAARIATVVNNFAQLPKRSRSNSTKFLQLFMLPGDFTKRIIRTKSGIIEFLATGQQCVVAGTHTSGVRYEWKDGLPTTIPALDPSTFEELWTALETEFATEPSATSTKSTKATQLKEAVATDPTAQYLFDNGWVLDQEKDGRLDITCPFSDEHTSDGAISATSYWPANTGGYALGHYKCLHAHCEHRSDEEFREAVGMSTGVLSDFDDLSSVPSPGTVKPKTDDLRFNFVPDITFSQGKAPPWIIEGVLPHAELAVIFGDSGSGKTFAALDFAAHISLGLDWQRA